MNEEQAKKLRAPFPETAIGKLPRVTQKDGQKKKCGECGGYLPPHIHLDYVGHAAVTDRLLEVDPEWFWEPVAFGPDGAPLVRKEGANATLWIRLTISGVTRFGVGLAPSNSFELEKQLISDAIRNAAMRFGVALDLWAKEDISHAHEEDSSAGGATPPRGSARPSRKATPEAAPPPRTHQRPEGEPTTLPPCEWSADDIRAMSPPQMMKALRDLGKKPEGTSEDWRNQLLELVQ